MNSTHAYIRDVVLPAANYLLPEKMHSETADLLLLGIGFQESRLIYRKQIGGPARGLLQFELAGVQGVLQHPATREHILRILKLLNYDFAPATSHEAITHNDILAFVYGRLNLWWDPKPLPAKDDVAALYDYYIRTWRPGKRRPEAWGVSYAQAMEVFNGDSSVRSV